MFLLFATREQKLLYHAARGNTQKVLRLLAKGADINATDEDGYTPLSLAIYGYYQETAEALIAAGANVNLKPLDEALLIRVAWYGWHSTAVAMIAAGADVNAAGNNGTTALIHAASRGHSDIVRTLIAAGADIHARNWESGALCAAINHHHPEVEQLLRTAGATLDMADAAYCGDIGRVQQLLAEGASPNEGNALPRAACNKHGEIVRLLMAAGADVDSTDCLDNTALHFAVRWGMSDIARLLLDAGADVHIENIDAHEEPLTVAVQEGQTDCVRLLLEKRDYSKEKINSRIEGITTLLHLAVDGGHTEIVRMLLQAGADVSIKRRYNKDTPLELALSNGHADIAALLRQAGAEE